jgi:hypothetical protein
MFMLALGIFALIQVTFLPGFLILRALGVREGFIRTLFYSLGLSLIANYCGVVILTLLGIYIPYVIYAIFIAECAALLLPYRKRLLKSGEQLYTEKQNSASEDNGWFNGWLEKTTDLSGLLTRISVFALGAIAIYFMLELFEIFLLNIGTVFQRTDSVIYWNHWAVQWAQNDLPLKTGLFPQLLPTNYSLFYVFMDDTRVQFFGKALMPLFPLFILLLMFDLGMRRKAGGFFLAVILARIFYRVALWEWLMDAFTEGMASFMAFLAVYVLFEAQETGELTKFKKLILLGGVFAAGAAAADKIGVYMVVVYPFLAYLMVLKDRPEISARQKWTLAGVALGLAALIGAPWYLYKEVIILSGREVSEISYITERLYGDYGYWQRFVNALGQLGKMLAGLYVVALVSLPFIKKDLRWLAILVVFPFSLAWSLFFSATNARNLTMGYQFLAVVAGIALFEVWKWLLKMITRQKMAVIVAAGAALMVILSLLIPGTKLVEQSLEAQRQLFNPKLNDLLYQNIPLEQGEFKILSKYAVRFLPGFEGAQIGDHFTDFDTFEKVVQNPKIDYILLPATAEKSIYDYLMTRVESGEYEILFDQLDYILLEKKK